MAMQRKFETASFMGVSRTAWLVTGFAIAWCWAFYLMREPQKPYAFDLPQAQLRQPITSPWTANYQATIFNCGRPPYYLPSCSNYCDPQSRIRYVECTSSQ